MMGAPVGRQDRLFYDFDLEEVVPDDHLLRKIDGVVDLSWLRCDLSAITAAWAIDQSVPNC